MRAVSYIFTRALTTTKIATNTIQAPIQQPSNESDSYDLINEKSTTLNTIKKQLRQTKKVKERGIQTMKTNKTILAELATELTDFSTRLPLMDKNMANVLENTNTFSKQVEIIIQK